MSLPIELKGPRPEGRPSARAVLRSGIRSRAQELLALIRNRRSIRMFHEREIPRQALERVLEAALWAPSGKNVQNWRFFVLTGKKRDEFLSHSQNAWSRIRGTLASRLKPSLYEFTERFFFTLGGAPTVVLAYAEKPGLNNPQTEIGNVYMAVQNLVLTAEAEGLGSCVMGAPLEVETDINAWLGTDLKLICAVVLGFPAHEPPPAPRKDGRITWLGD